jgi:hypothetical protein
VYKNWRGLDSLPPRPLHPGKNFLEPNIELAPTAMNFPNRAVGVKVQPGEPDFIQSRLNKIG